MGQYQNSVRFSAVGARNFNGLGSEAMLSAAISLNLESRVPDRVALWRLRQSNPLRKGQGGRKN